MAHVAQRVALAAKELHTAYLLARQVQRDGLPADVDPQAWAALLDRLASLTPQVEGAKRILRTEDGR